MCSSRQVSCHARVPLLIFGACGIPARSRALLTTVGQREERDTLHVSVYYLISDNTSDEDTIFSSCTASVLMTWLAQLICLH